MARAFFLFLRRYDPARQHGKPVDVLLTIEVSFDR